MKSKRTNKDKVLYTLQRRPEARSQNGMPVSAVCKFTHLTPSAVSSAVTSLRKSGSKITKNVRKTESGRQIVSFIYG